MGFTLDTDKDQKTCDCCGVVMPLSSGHVCAHILHAHVRKAKGLEPLGFADGGIADPDPNPRLVGE